MAIIVSQELVRSLREAFALRPSKRYWPLDAWAEQAIGQRWIAVSDSRCYGVARPTNGEGLPFDGGCLQGF